MSRFHPILTRIYRKMPKTPFLIRGNLVLMKRSCGQMGCRCQKGQKHASWYLSQSIGGKTRMTYLPKAAFPKVRRYTENHKEFRKVLEELSNANLKLLVKKTGKGRGQA